MNATYDIDILGGLVADGSGFEPIVTDLAISGPTIAVIGRVEGSGREAIDARGKLVTLDFMDIHTHYDGQATWESRMRASSWHGVATVIGGNYGVGFAPCRSQQREMFVRLMEGVEDVPEIVMEEALPWAW